MSVLVKVAGKWQQIGVDASGSGVPWAKVTGGTVTTYTKPDGAVMEVHTFTASGTLTVDEPGYAEVLLVGAGGPDNAPHLATGLHSLAAGSLPVSVGTDMTDAGAGLKSPSYIGSYPTLLWAASSVTALSAGDGVGAGGARAAKSDPTRSRGIISSITGSPVEYGKAIGGNSYPGAGGGGPGVVIVAVQKSAPTVSGVVATGGTVTDYTGDGTNGVLGQKYRVHTFTASGTLDVSQGGECDVLVVGGGSYNPNTASQGGEVNTATLTLSSGSLPVTVGVQVPGQQEGPPSWIGPTWQTALVRAAGGRTRGTVHLGAGYSPVPLAGNSPDGVMSNISGTLLGYGGAVGSVGYGWVNVSTEPRANSGAVGRADNTQGAAGVVIVRYAVA